MKKLHTKLHKKLHEEFRNKLHEATFFRIIKVLIIEKFDFRNETFNKKLNMNVKSLIKLA